MLQMKLAVPTNSRVPMESVYRKDGYAIWITTVVMDLTNRIARRYLVLLMPNFNVQRVIALPQSGCAMEITTVSMEKTSK